MIPLTSKLENREMAFGDVKDTLDGHAFRVGGGWDYKGGSFDRPLDEAHKVWLRLPFTVTSGELDPETDENAVTIRFGKPFVLKHLYNEGLDGEAQFRTIGGLVDQFQEPTDADASVEQEWIERAELLLRRTESLVQ